MTQALMGTDAGEEGAPRAFARAHAGLPLARIHAAICKATHALAAARAVLELAGVHRAVEVALGAAPVAHAARVLSLVKPAASRVPVAAATVLPACLPLAKEDGPVVVPVRTISLGVAVHQLDLLPPVVVLNNR